MGICTECKHHKYTQVNLGRTPPCIRREPPLPSGHWCLNDKKLDTDYVTGKTYRPDCYSVNAFGECLDFEKAEDEEEQNETSGGEETAGGTSVLGVNPGTEETESANSAGGGN